MFRLEWVCCVQSALFCCFAFVSCWVCMSMIAVAWWVFMLCCCTFGTFMRVCLLLFRLFLCLIVCLVCAAGSGFWVWVYFIVSFCLRCCLSAVLTCWFLIADLGVLDFA